MQVRSATFEDCDAIGAGMKVVVDEGRWLATEDATAEELANRFRQVILEAKPLFVLEERGEIVGALGLHSTAAAGVAAVGMWVAPEHRGRGGGRMLMEAALAGRPEDTHKIELEVWPDNEAAISLYRKMGFEEEGLRRDHYRRRDGSRRSSLIMARLFG
ncbi:MAG TPA: GNAT family N-acetyltransferase [Solirubrobacterales bacterium]|nr:GNAT family N-acetyltransferase [Solirubrobacterales bacterium]